MFKTFNQTNDKTLFENHINFFKHNHKHNIIKKIRAIAFAK